MISYVRFLLMVFAVTRGNIVTTLTSKVHTSMSSFEADGLTPEVGIFFTFYACLWEHFLFFFGNVFKFHIPINSHGFEVKNLPRMNFFFLNLKRN